MAIPISNVTRRVVYAASGTGPYAFTFEILVNTDIAVYKDDTLLTLTTDYTVTINANGTGSITLVASPTGATQIAIVGNRTIQRTTDFVTGGDFFANTVNDELDQQTIFNQQNAEGLQRALQAPQTDPTSINMTLPRVSLRAGKVLSFDASGNPKADDYIGSNRGNWASGTLYYVRDIVKDTSNSNIYQCLTQHTSSGSQPISTNTDSAKWFLLVDAASSSASATLAQDWATKTNGQVASTDYSAKAWSIGGTGVTNGSGAAKEWATKTSGTVDGSIYSAKEYAAGSQASTGGSAKNWAQETGGAVTGASTNDRSAKAWAQSALTGATLGGSAKDWAQYTGGTVDGTSYSAKYYSQEAATSATLANDWATKTSGTVAGGEYSAKYHAQAAATSASNASTSASNAASAQSAAEAARDQTLTAFDNFDDRYLGTKSSDPTLDNDGNALVAGALYFNSSSGTMKVYTGSAWVAAYVSGSDFLPLTGGTMTGAITFAAGQTISGYQTTLVSGTSIKTVNSTSLLGSGNVAVQDTLVSGTNIKTINGSSVLGSGDLSIGGGAQDFILFTQGVI